MSGPDRITNLELSWLQRALGAHVSAPVVSFEAHPVSFAGATTDMARLVITYATDDTAGPSSLIAKLRGQRDVQRQMDQAMGLYQREARFYATLADQVPVRTPRCWAVGDGDTTPLLLEDLDGLRMGDQIEGMALLDAESMMDALADMHAAFWESDQLGQPWLAAPAEGRYADMISQLVASGAPVLAQRYHDQVSTELMSMILHHAADWNYILTQLAKGPQTLIHNDTRLDNLFFLPDGTPCLIDWQIVARSRGTQDVGNLLAGSMNGDDLSKHWERLLRRYHNRLVAAGVSGYSFEHCLRHYRQSVIYPLGAGMALLGAMNIGDGRGLGDRIVSRCLRHISEIDAFAALPTHG